MRQPWLFDQLEIVLRDFRQHTDSSTPLLTVLQESMNSTLLSSEQQIALEAQVAGETTDPEVFMDFVEKLWPIEWEKIPAYFRTSQADMKKAWLTKTCDHVAAQYQEFVQPALSFVPEVSPELLDAVEAGRARELLEAVQEHHVPLIQTAVDQAYDSATEQLPEFARQHLTSATRQQIVMRHYYDLVAKVIAAPQSTGRQVTDTRPAQELSKSPPQKVRYW